MSYLRSKMVAQAQSWLGCNEKDGSFKKIIDIYNSQKSLPVGYKVKYTDEWCATFVTACAVVLNYTSIIYPECSCGRMIALYQKNGRWMENDAYVPNPGDIIFYDWQDSGVGDNKGAPDHVGLVEKVVNGVITVIEGNKSESVSRREIKVNGKYIRGYGLPKYDEETSTTSQSVTLNRKITTLVDEKLIWDLLIKEIGNAYGVAGVMGNLYAESGLVSARLQGDFASGYKSSIEYTNKVDSNIIDREEFAKKGPNGGGYGLAQWTYYTRKYGLYDYAKSIKSSIGNVNTQVEYLLKELKQYKAVWKTITTAKSVSEASTKVLTDFESPKDQSASVKATRTKYSNKYYNAYAKSVNSSNSSTSSKEIKATTSARSYDKSLAGTYMTTASLNIRNGAGTNFDVLVTVPEGTKVSNYGYFTKVLDGTKWMYVQFIYNGVTYTAFASGKYLKKK